MTRQSPHYKLSEEQQRKRVAWLLRDRARLVRLAGLDFYQLPKRAQNALDSFAPILDEAADLLGGNGSTEPAPSRVRVTPEGAAAASTDAETPADE